MVAPSIGGWLTDLFNWRAVFFINLPVGLLALILSWFFIPAEEKPVQMERFDFTGALLFMAGLVALLLWLNQGHDWGWISVASALSLTIAIGCLAVFTRIEYQRPSPMLDMSLFKDSVFSLSIISAVLIYMAIFSILFLMPFYLIQGRELSPSQAGLILTIQPFVMAIAAPFSGTLSDRFGTRIPCILGMGILSIGLYFLTQLDPSTSYGYIAVALGLAGLGIGTFISPNNSAIMGSASRNRQGIAAAILATARSVGMVLGIGLSGAIMTTMLSNTPGNQQIFEAVQVSFYAALGIAILGLIVTTIKVNNRSSLKRNGNGWIETS
jgi:EmrB/QacA subfamily drug resistance transporter